VAVRLESFVDDSWGTNLLIGMIVKNVNYRKSQICLKCVNKGSDVNLI
jgi:hypothetical protein